MDGLPSETMANLHRTSTDTISIMEAQEWPLKEPFEPYKADFVD